MIDAHHDHATRRDDGGGSLLPYFSPAYDLGVASAQNFHSFVSTHHSASAWPFLRTSE